MRKDPTNEKTEARSLLLDKNEEELCRRLNLTFPNFILIKEGILRQNVRLGSLSKGYVYKMFKLDSQIIEKVFDHLVNQEEIIEEEIDA